MSFVLDASTTLAWCFEDESSAQSHAILERLLGDEAVAPAVWPLEVANGLRSAERRGRIDEREIPGVTRLLGALPVRVQESRLQHVLTGVLPLARALGVSTYDAAYVDLALQTGLPLATADEQLAQAALAAGVTLLDDAA